MVGAKSIFRECVVSAFDYLSNLTRRQC
jgi:hypothetical protein